MKNTKKVEMFQEFQIGKEAQKNVLGGTGYIMIGWDVADPNVDPQNSFMDIVLTNGNGEWVGDPICHIPDREGLGMIDG